MKKPVDILGSMVSQGEGTSLPGTFDISIENVTTSQEVLDRLRAFGGTGWLCLSSSSEIVRYHDAQMLQGLEGWPLCGEAVLGEEGEKSLRLIRERESWNLVQSTRVPASSEYDVLVQSRFIARDKGTLRYETCWKLQDVAGQEEMRPWAFRFIGFEKKEKEE